MRINLNGDPTDVAEALSLDWLVPEPRGVAVAVNGSVITAADWSRTTLFEHDRVEIVTAHQGG